ncbi:hypothetical protein TrispH2_011689 [Trichoplax sp. H2]|nr:hypothetical protein TrispH2_011689 [Trichoplax sp. H2]|eukprot:RDD36229.1 hypothetical protein TrispH2_011689 [Trichoplax sp. H2]
MLLQRERYFKKKIIGGNLLGNLFDRAKKVISIGSKIVKNKITPIKKALKPLGNKAIQAGKQTITSQAKKLGDKAIQASKQTITSQAKKLGDQVVKNIINEDKAVIKQIEKVDKKTTKNLMQTFRNRIKDNVTNLSTNPQVRKVLNDKSRAILSNILSGSGVKTVNNGLSLFRSAQYQINNHTVEEINDWLPYASTILNLVMYSDDYSRSIATNMLWYRDTATGKPNMTEFDMTESFPVSIASDVVTVKAKQIRDMKLVTNPQYNRGFHARQLLTTGDKQISLLIPLSSIFGFCKDVDTVFRGVKHTLQLDRAATANYILKDSNIDDGKFKISHVSMWMPKVTPSLEVASQLEAKLVSGHISNLYFEQVKVYMTQYAANQTSPTWRITTQPGTELPRHIFIVFQSTERENNQTMNNMIFDNADVRRISARINSIQYPEREIECNFHPSNRNYSRPYMMFMEAVHKYQDTDTGSQLSAEDWANLYPIFHFDVSKHNERLKNSPADIEVKWTLGKNFKSINNNSNDVPYYVYAVVLTDRYLQLHGLGGRMNKNAISKAYQHNKAITIRLLSHQLQGNDNLGLTLTQHNKVIKARKNNKSVILKLSRNQVSKQAGFLGALMGLIRAAVPAIAKAAPKVIKSVVPKLAMAAATGGISGATHKATGGRGFLSSSNIYKMPYSEYGVNISPSQKQKLKSAINAKKGCTIRLSRSDLTGPDKLYLTRRQINKINKAKLKNTGCDIKLSKTQVAKNGGFIGALLAGILPAVISGIAGRGVTLPGTIPKKGKGLKKKNL